MDLAVLQCYVHVVEDGSFSSAARRMGISKSMCSKHISDLEASLGVRLLTRSTRSVKPTAVGVEYYGKVRAVLEQLQAASESVRAYSDHAIGTLKIGSPISYTLKVLQPYILRFMAQYPDIQIDMVLDDRCQDIIGEGFDAVIRIGELEDSALMARRLYGSKSYLVAAPRYLAEHGTPQVPGDLARHRCLHYTNMRGTTWTFRQGGDVYYQKVHPIFTANNGDMIRAAAVAGLGIAIMPQFLIDDEFDAGHLVPIMDDFNLPDLPISLVYPSRKNATAALRIFLDFVAGLDIGQPAG